MSLWDPWSPARLDEDAFRPLPALRNAWVATCSGEGTLPVVELRRWCLALVTAMALSSSAVASILWPTICVRPNVGLVWPLRLDLDFTPLSGLGTNSFFLVAPINLRASLAEDSSPQGSMSSSLLLLLLLLLLRLLLFWELLTLRIDVPLTPLAFAFAFAFAFAPPWCFFPGIEMCGK